MTKEPMMDRYIILLFMLNFLLVFLILKRCKLSFFSLKIVAVNYILLPLLYQYVFHHSYGLLELGKTQMHYGMILSTIAIYNLTFLILLKKTKILCYEGSKLREGYYINNSKKYILMLLAIVCSIIAFPSLPFSYDASVRFQALLPGHAWNHIAIICLIFLIGNLRKDTSVKIVYSFVIFWFLSHYERVDVIGLIVAVAVFYIAKRALRFKKINFRTVVKIIVSGAIVFATMIYVGGARSGEGANLDLLKNIVVQKTASDIAYVYDISIDYANGHEALYGRTYGRYIVELIPLAQYDGSINNILSSNYYYSGGEYILSAPIMNFGVLGIPMFAAIEFWLLSVVYKSKTRLSYVIYIFLLATVFRVNWYGLNYIETGIVYIIPLIYLFVRKNFVSISNNGRELTRGE